jgi:hypothetical protein
MANHHPEMALEYYLRLKRSDVIRIIEQYKLYPSLQHEAVLFMDYNAYWAGQELSKSPSDLSMEDLRHGKAVQMLIHAVDAIPVSASSHSLSTHPSPPHTATPIYRSPVLSSSYGPAPNSSMSTSTPSTS